MKALSILLLFITTTGFGQISDYGIGQPIDSIKKSQYFPPNNSFLENGFYHFVYNNKKYNTSSIYITKKYTGIIIGKVLVIPDTKQNTKHIKNFLNLSESDTLVTVPTDERYKGWYLRKELAIQVKTPIKKMYIVSIVNIKLMH